MRYWFVPFALWAGFFILFLNVDRWQWSATKKILVALACAIGAAVVAVVAGLFIVNFFD